MLQEEVVDVTCGGTEAKETTAGTAQLDDTRSLEKLNRTMCLSEKVLLLYHTSMAHHRLPCGGGKKHECT